MRKIGVISDTHNYLNSRIPQYFSGVDMIFHAGDIGATGILESLQQIAPVKAVRGNTDYKGNVSALPKQLTVVSGKLTFLILHDVGNINSFREQLNQGKFDPLPRVIIFGHTHQAFYKKIDEYIFINPGSATSSRDHRKPSIMILEANESEITSHRLIEL